MNNLYSYSFRTIHLLLVLYHLQHKTMEGVVQAIFGTLKHFAISVRSSNRVPNLSKITSKKHQQTISSQ